MLPSADAWVETGWSLGPEQRDFRVYNNFSDPIANDNREPHTSFPGHTGAVLAIWKGCVEWGSAPHGDGEGDPDQPGGLGSGEANFDPSFQGLAPGSGDIGDNTLSELAGCSGGTYAFCESFVDGSGWRIWFYECWLWEDSATTDWLPEVGKFDLQGMAAHEYGHALGLGHSADPNATMYASTSDAKGYRTIERDDVAGVQAIYGTRSPWKPRIEKVSINATTLTISGEFFAPTGNEVWFTRGSGTGDGTPVMVTDVPSANGDQLIVGVPPEAGPGDILVRVGPGGGERLSNAFPFDTRLACDPIVTICETTPNSVGSGAQIRFSGSQSVSANSATLLGGGLPPHQFGLFFYGPSTTHIPVGNGILCVGGHLFRLPVVQADSGGMVGYSLNFDSLPGGGAIGSGSLFYFQLWYRDPIAGGAQFNFSDAIGVPFCD